MPAALTIRVDDESKLQKLDALCKATDRSRNWLVNQALSTYLDLQSWQITKIEAGLAEANRGEFASDEAVEAVFNAYKTEK